MKIPSPVWRGAVTGSLITLGALSFTALVQVNQQKAEISALQNQVHPQTAAVTSAPRLPSSGHQRTNSVRSGLSRKIDGVPGSLVYACSAWPCQYDQVFATYDQYNNPLFVIGPYGNIASFGLAISETPLGDVFHGRVTWGWESPVTYNTTLGFPVTCTAPSWWVAPTDDGLHFAVWSCVSGAWVKKGNLF